MMTTRYENDVRTLFIEFNSTLKKYKPWRIFKQKAPDNIKLKSAASRITVPHKFEPYIKIVEQTTDFRFSNFEEFTTEEVRSQDDKILKSYSSENFDWDKINLSALIKCALISSNELMFDKVGIELCDLRESANSFQSSSSSCFPDYKKKGDPIAINNAVDFANDYLSSPPDLKKLFSQITTLFHRFQYKIDSSGNIDKKARPIWGIPFGINVIEGFFFRKFVTAIPLKLKELNINTTTLGRNLNEISDIVSTLRRFNSELITLDLAAFDSTIPSFMWALFFAIIFKLKTFDSKYDDHFISLMIYYCYTPYMYSSDEIKYQRKGNPSGCLLTAIFNTWVNRTIINYAHYMATNGSYLPGENLCVLGDDNIFPTTYVNIEYISNTYRKFGMQVNLSKTEVVNTKGIIPFLGYLWDNRNRAIQSEKWFITHLCLPSSFATNLDIPVSLFQTFRAISVCMPLYNGYSMFMKLIGYKDFVFKDLYDKYLRGDDTLIQYITSDRRFENLYFPFSLFLKGSWNAKADFVTTEQL